MERQRKSRAGLEEAQGAEADEVEGVGDDRIATIFGELELDDRTLGGERALRDQAVTLLASAM